MKDSPVISGGLSIVTTDCITEHLCKVQEDSFSFFVTLLLSNRAPVASLFSFLVFGEGY